MDKLRRFSEIDDMRGLAILVMILIHTNAYFLSDKIAYILWNLSQFAVPVFLFCSAYVYYQHKHEHVLNNFPSYLKKRFKRLLIPYYIFAVIFLILVKLEEPARATTTYILQSLLIVGGIDINWLVFLFLFITIIMPIIGYFNEKKKIFFYLYSALAIISSIIFIFYNWPFNYKYIMWFPWSVMLIYTIYFIFYQRYNFFYPATVIFSGIIFFVSWLIELKIHHSLSFYDNKYPPNIFLLSYGIASIAVLHFFANVGGFSFKPFSRILNFLSVNSYSIYFIHYIYLYLLSFLIWRLHFNWIMFFLVVLIPSLFTQKILNFTLKVLLSNR